MKRITVKMTAKHKKLVQGTNSATINNNGALLKNY